MRDYHELVKMTQAADLLTCQQSGVVEASDLDDQTRHMDMDYAVIRWSDKPFVCYGTSGPKARDAVEPRRHRLRRPRGDRADARRMLGVVNPNSPLVWDWLMADALIGVGSRSQPVRRHTVPARRCDRTGLDRRRARPADRRGALRRRACPDRAAGRAVRVRLVLQRGRHAHRRPVVWHSRVGARLHRRRPARAALQAPVPRRRRPLLRRTRSTRRRPRSRSMMLWATFMAGSDLVMHAAGWLEGGLTASYEKLALDLEVLRMFVIMRGHRDRRGGVRARRDPRGGPRRHVPRIDAHARALPRLGVHEPAVQVPGLRHLGEAGRARPPTIRPPREWKALLESYEDPGIDPAIDEELQEYITRRRSEIEAEHAA